MLAGRGSAESARTASRNSLSMWDVGDIVTGTIAAPAVYVITANIHSRVVASP
jgi:hypothetical protein